MKCYFRMFCTRWKLPVFLCIKNVFVGFLWTLKEHSILSFWKRYETLFSNVLYSLKTSSFYVLRTYFVGFLRTLQEHSTLPLWKNYENIIMACFIHVQTVQFPIELSRDITEILCIKNVFCRVSANVTGTFNPTTLKKLWKHHYGMFYTRSNCPVPYRAVTRHHGDFSVMGTSSLQPFLKSYWLTPVKWLANCRKACKYDELETV